MSSATVARLKVEQISEHDRERVTQFIAEDASSPVSVFLQRILHAAQDGTNLSILTEDAEVTPNEAAELLKMSRPHLLTFMDRGDLPFHRVGTHRRIAMRDLFDFMAAREAGAQILANALSDTGKPLAQPAELTDDERDELLDL